MAAINSFGYINVSKINILKDIQKITATRKKLPCWKEDL